MPTRDRPVQLGRCLAALRRVEDPGGGFEVLVVDDGGSTPLEPVLAASAGPETALLSGAGSGPAEARNVGAVAARGSFLAFTDDDCEPAPGWLRALRAAFDSRPAGTALGGRTVNALTANVWAAASQVIVDLAHRHAKPRFFASNNLAVPAGDFRALGGFDPSFRTAEDRELCDRWARSGRGMAHVPEAVVRHGHDLRPSSFWRQHQGYGRGARAFHRSRRAAGAPPFRPEAAFYARVAVAPLVRPPAGVPRPGLAGALALAQVANLAGFVRARPSAPLPLAPLRAASE